MKAIYLNTRAYEPHVIEIEDNLEAYYKLIHTDNIDIINRKIGNKRFTIICDGEGLLKNDITVSAVNSKNQPVLVGNLVIVSSTVTDDGELTGLTNNDALHVLHHMEKRFTHKFPEGYFVLTKCEF